MYLIIAYTFKIEIHFFNNIYQFNRLNLSISSLLIFGLVSLLLELKCCRCSFSFYIRQLRKEKEFLFKIIFFNIWIIWYLNLFMWIFILIKFDFESWLSGLDYAWNIGSQIAIIKLMALWFYAYLKVNYVHFHLT